MEYKELSRRGLIKLNGDFDEKNENKLKEFLNEKGEAYEEVRPFEQIVERMDDVSEAVEAKGGAVSEAIMNRVNHVFDSIVNSLSEEVSRCNDIIEEGKDGETFPDTEEA